MKELIRRKGVSGRGNSEGKGPEVGISGVLGGRRLGCERLGGWALRLGVSKQRVIWNRGGNSKLFIRLFSQPKSRR